ncbi:MAG: O-antigen ligase domain-containing protein [Acaryochloris sp. RU_4_1]|nr:O-antigen ligase domain-containing protein [Acaryochloris sp. RU_4_1]NJR54700.1 O-antigen ligase domain-containing protein [Acaryochloris sp. CRU_2_0]
MATSSDSQFDDRVQSNPSSLGVSDGSLLGILSLGLYALFTLLPDSHSLMVVWPWVLFWQVTWVCPLLWFIWQIWQTQTLPRLHQGLDWIAALAIIGLILSTLLARFPDQARWYTGPALGGIATIYTVKTWCQTPERRQRLLMIQGLLSSGLILVSLALWFNQTFWPELSRIWALQAAGMQTSYNFSVLELRNWAPFGHQNYVAGYLVLALPLFLGLWITSTGYWRGWWAISLGLGLLDLYTTSSRGGWIGCVVSSLYLVVALFQRQDMNRRWLMGGSLVSLGVLVVLVLANNRLSSQISQILKGQASGEMAYRIITHAAAWRMGWQNPGTGMGLGSVPLAYQAYRPAWAGLEAEQVYQLHGTLGQVWAELGLAGSIPYFLILGWLVYQSWRWTCPAAGLAISDSFLIQTSLAGLLGYSAVSLTDYQLDNIGISGFIAISFGVLAASCRRGAMNPLPTKEYRRSGKGWFQQRLIAGILLGLVLAMSLWLVPIQDAWRLSSRGFVALGQQQFDRFRQHLGEAQAKAPWEPYYAYQLGWNIGELGFNSQDPKLRQYLLQSATQYFIRGNQVSADQEFGHTNLGWLYMQLDPPKATQAFVRSAELVPAKRGVFFGLGMSLLAQNQTDLALEAMTLECLRNPLWITSPAWRSQPLLPLYDPLLTALEKAYGQLMQAHPHLDELNTHLHQSRGSLQWWRGNLAAAQADLDPYGSSLSRVLIKASPTAPGTKLALSPALPTPAQYLLQAWSDPAQRADWIAKAWLTHTQNPASPELVKAMLTGMAKAQTFEQWLQTYPVVRKYHRQRAGFGVLSRHTDGPNPTDFFLVIDNVVMSEIFADMMPTPMYLPALDRLLQERRTALLGKVKALSANAMLTSSLFPKGVMD